MSTNPAMITVNASNTHCTSAADAPSAVRIEPQPTTRPLTCAAIARGWFAYHE